MNKHRQPREWAYLRRDTTAWEEQAEGCGRLGFVKQTTQTERTQMKDLLERILRPANLEQAYQQVVRNKGAGGVDGMAV